MVVLSQNICRKKNAEKQYVDTILATFALEFGFNDGGNDYNFDFK